MRENTQPQPCSYAPVTREKYCNTLIHNFFESYAEQAAPIRSRLSAPLILFPENVGDLISDDNDVNERINFMPYLRQPHAEDLWCLNGGLPEGSREVSNWAVLYAGL